MLIEEEKIEKTEKRLIYQYISTDANSLKCSWHTDNRDGAHKTKLGLTKAVWLKNKAICVEAVYLCL